MIREIKADEIETVAHLGTEFFAEAKLPGSFRPAVFCRTWKNLITLGMGFVLAAYKGNDRPVGILGAIVTQDINDGETVAQEAFWFMSAESRGSLESVRLFRMFEQTARERGAKRFIMVHLLALKADKLSKFYERMGYRAVEVNFVKEI